MLAGIRMLAVGSAIARAALHTVSLVPVCGRWSRRTLDNRNVEHALDAATIARKLPGDSGSRNRVCVGGKSAGDLTSVTWAQAWLTLRPGSAQLLAGH